MRVASVPADHVYIRHLAPSGHDDGVVRLPDPPSEEPGRWWPPVMLDPEWVAEHSGDFDLMHIHFGFDARSPEDLQKLADALETAGRPLVFTVHDLRNPHHETTELHDAQLDVLVPAASELITLTPGAAREIEHRWGRKAHVLHHPHVFELDEVGRVRPGKDEFLVGVHCKSLRACMEPEPVIRAIVQTLPELPGARLGVDAHTDIMTPGYDRYDDDLATYLRRADADGLLDLQVHDYFTHDELRDYLRSLDLSVLPYRHGTHSGWAEGCHDLGTGVLAPDCGYYADQLDCFVYRWDEFGLDAHSVQSALCSAYDSRGNHPMMTSAERRLQRDRLADAHVKIYSAALGN